jgi:hypothetical protein
MAGAEAILREEWFRMHCLEVRAMGVGNGEEWSTDWSSGVRECVLGDEAYAARQPHLLRGCQGG